MSYLGDKYQYRQADGSYNVSANSFERLGDVLNGARIYYIPTWELPTLPMRDP